MTEKDEELLTDLLLSWEEQRERGEEVTATVLCQDSPHLLEELSRRINALKAVSWLDNPLSSNSGDVESEFSVSSQPRTLLGRYRLDDLIATGGFAHVWRGYDLELQRIVAIKVPRPSRLQSSETFIAEARRVARLKHPGVVPVFDVGHDADSCFIVSEFVEGGSLGDHLSRNPPTPQQAIRWTIEIAHALEYAHLHGVIHRDIKPANILIDHHGRALLADFGIAQSANKAGQEALSLGTLRYMSPEQLEGRPVDCRSDIFSLGVVLHEALAGKLPYSSAEPNVLRREIVAGVSVSATEIPDRVKQVCQKALQRELPHRYQSAAQFAADLQKCLIKTTRPWWRWFMVAAVVLVSGVIALQWAMLLPEEKQELPRINAATPEQASKQRVTPPQTAAELIAQGKMLLDQNYLDRAARKFTEALQVDPSSTESFDKRGVCKFKQGAFRDSLADFDNAIQLDPKAPDLRIHRAMSYSSLRQFDPAIIDMEEALLLNPSNPAEVQKTLAIIYSNRASERSNSKKYAGAADDVTQAIKYLPQANVFYHQRGSCYFNMQQFEKAAADFTEAIRREPSKGSHYLHRGYCMQALGKNTDAAADFEKAKSLGNVP